MDILVIVITVVIISTFWEWRRRKLIGEIEVSINRNHKAIRKALGILEEEED
ncbi:hypothetical protein LCGC14_2817680 [marine sediment metagenome]|uniref:Uncharacterized protein n=1 Tax=marine sediment metagenome TaxID=412755 RepID=A0A0F8YHZ6_9ZZZZ